MIIGKGAAFDLGRHRARARGADCSA
jgi:hypothetical protein